MAKGKPGAQWIINPAMKNRLITDDTTDFLQPASIQSASHFIKSVAGYQPTPLIHLSQLASYWNLENIMVKDESHRFGLNAFKVLGGIYAVANVICRKLDVKVDSMSFKELTSNAVKEKIGNMVFVTATDGNHGRGIAWAARQLGQKAVVFMPKGSSISRMESIQNEGALVTITEMNYDDAVRHAKQYAEECKGTIVQDTAWDNYEEIPRWIMQGYAVIADEIRQQLVHEENKQPTHIFLQAGVGSFAAAIQGYLFEVYGEKQPIVVLMESDQADCFYRTAMIDDGLPHSVTGHMNTIMAGLACGEPNLIGWKILRKHTYAFVSCPDYLAARGMRILAAPLPGDQPICSGESGAIGIGLLDELMHHESMAVFKHQLALDQNSRILFISTEGDTDPEQYRSIVWDGAYSSLS